MTTVNGLKACDTCRAAKRALEAAGQDVVLRDFRADPPMRGELEGWFGQFGDALLNKRSTTWRGLDEAERAGDPLDLLMAHPTLIKRPVIVAGDAVHLGWTKDVRAALGL